MNEAAHGFMFRTPKPANQSDGFLDRILFVKGRNGDEKMAESQRMLALVGGVEQAWPQGGVPLKEQQMASRNVLQLLLAASTILYSGVLAAKTFSYVSGNGEVFMATYNIHGVTLRSRHTIIHLGTSCDALSPQYGEGTWGQANGGFKIDFSRFSIGFPRQELFEDDDSVKCGLND